MKNPKTKALIKPSNVSNNGIFQSCNPCQYRKPSIFNVVTNETYPPKIPQKSAIIINIGKAIGSAVTWSGLGSVDKAFGLIFGIFKGYVICVCIFSLLNWFYPHQKWPLKAEGTYSFEMIYKGSSFLIDEFPKSKDYYENTEEKIEKI